MTGNPSVVLKILKGKDLGVVFNSITMSKKQWELNKCKMNEQILLQGGYSAVWKTYLNYNNVQREHSLMDLYIVIFIEALCIHQGLVLEI